MPPTPPWPAVSGPTTSLSRLMPLPPAAPAEAGRRRSSGASPPVNQLPRLRKNSRRPRRARCATPQIRKAKCTVHEPSPLAQKDRGLVVLEVVVAGQVHRGEDRHEPGQRDARRRAPRRRGVRSRSTTNATTNASANRLVDGERDGRRLPPDLLPGEHRQRAQKQQVEQSRLLTRATRCSTSASSRGAAAPVRVLRARPPAARRRAGLRRPSGRPALRARCSMPRRVVAVDDPARLRCGGSGRRPRRPAAPPPESAVRPPGTRTPCRRRPRRRGRRRRGSAAAARRPRAARRAPAVGQEAGLLPRVVDAQPVRPVAVRARAGRPRTAPATFPPSSGRRASSAAHGGQHGPRRALAEERAGVHDHEPLARRVAERLEVARSRRRWGSPSSARRPGLELAHLGGDRLGDRGHGALPGAPPNGPCAARPRAWRARRRAHSRDGDATATGRGSRPPRAVRVAAATASPIRCVELGGEVVRSRRSCGRARSGSPAGTAVAAHGSVLSGISIRAAQA